MLFGIATGHDNIDIEINKLVISKCGNFLLTASMDETAKLIDITTRQVVTTFTGHLDSVTCAIFGSDINQVFTSSRDGIIKQWKISTSETGSKRGKCIQTFSCVSKSVSCLLYDAIYNRLFSSSHDGTITCWTLQFGEEEVIAKMNDHKKQVYSLCFVNSNLIASCSSDCTIKLWDIITLKCIKTLETNADCIVMSIDKTHLYSVDRDNIQVWNIVTGENTKTLSNNDIDMYNVVISQDGSHVVSSFDRFLNITSLSF